MRRKQFHRLKNLHLLCLIGGFRITKWNRNCKAVISSSEKERAKEVKHLDLRRDILPVDKALGM